MAVRKLACSGRLLLRHSDPDHLRPLKLLRSIDLKRSLVGCPRKILQAPVKCLVGLLLTAGPFRHIFEDKSSGTKDQDSDYVSSWKNFRL